MSYWRFEQLLLIGIIAVIYPRITHQSSKYISYDPLVLCNADYKPDECGLPSVSLSSMSTVEDFDRCGPAVIPQTARNYYWGAAGRKRTYAENFEAYNRIEILPRMLRNVSEYDLSTTVLGQKIAFPIGLSALAQQKMAHADGEVGTARAAAKMGTIMMLSTLSSTKLEEVALNAKSAAAGKPFVLWMQIYIVKNRENTLQIARRAEAAGYKALVVTVDTPFLGSISCGSSLRPGSPGTVFPNLDNNTFEIDNTLTFDDITWLKKRTKLPIVAKGIMRGDDALSVIQAGASAILVSNHGGRQVDGGLATIEALQDVLKALKWPHPTVEVYVDGGIRNGFNAYKAIALGARAVFVGRPIVWGLGIGGEAGVEKVLSILKSEFNETMLLTGARNPEEILSNTVRVWPSSRGVDNPRYLREH